LRVALLVAMLTGGLLVSFVGLVSLAYAATAAAMTIAQAATQTSQRTAAQPTTSSTTALTDAQKAQQLLLKLAAKDPA
jgi:hypothetical protein